MIRIGETLGLSASDLVGLNCRHLTDLVYSDLLSTAQGHIPQYSFLVGLPALFAAECKTPRQMQMANASCRYFEMATVLDRVASAGVPDPG